MNQIPKAMEFQKTFGAPLRLFASDISWLLGRFDFDIVAFDAWCKRRHGYKEDGKTSLKKFVTEKWGTVGLGIIEYLIKLRRTA